MWKLSIEDDQGNRTVVNLARDEYSLGRAEDNTVRLTERNISRKHARLVRNGVGWNVEDLKSYNGCFVNGVRVSGPRAIEAGDLVQLGDYRLEVISDTAAVSTAPTSSRPATQPSVPKSQALIGQPDRLVMLIGPTPGIEYPLLGERLVIGRGEECDIAINHGSVSRVHAEIQLVGDSRYEIIDRDSANGVRVNGVELKRALLDARDRIELGDVVVKFIPAGQIYRADADESHQLAAASAVPSQRHASTLAAKPRPRPSAVPSFLKWVAGAALATVLVGAVIIKILNNRAPLPEGTSTVARSDEAVRALSEAKTLLLQGQIEAAHLKATREIPIESNARESQDFHEIEARWADLVFADATREMDPTKKRALLDQVAKAPTVDSGRRKQAANEIAQLDGDGVDVTELPSQVPDAKPPKAASPTARLVGGLVRRNPFDAPNAQELATSGDRAKAARAKNILEGKASSGRATMQDLRMLRALCGQLGDAACRARANALLAARQNQGD